MKKISFLTILVAFLTLKFFGQNLGINYELKSPLSTGQHIYEASEYINLKPGFNSKPTGNLDLFHAMINPFLVFPPEIGVTGGPLAQDNGVVGTLPGVFNVSDAGAATYTIPIELPQGIMGVMPQLALNYNSQSGNGLLGLGWNLISSSSIHRIATTYYHDNYIDGVDFDNNDMLAIDGMRLFKNQNTNEYYTELNDYSRIKVMESDQYGPVWFEVQTKDGKILQYGKSYDSRQFAGGRQDILKWHLSKISDQKGNYIEFKYGWNFNSYKLVSINYGGNDKTESMQAPIYDIFFTYVDRPDDNEYFISGSSSKIESTLSLIEIRHRQLNNKLLMKYVLNYNLDGFYPRLTSVTKEDEFGNTLNPTKFEWGLNAAQMTLNVNNVQMTNSRDYTFGDFNGDGKSDIVCANYHYENFEKVYTTWDVYYSNGSNLFTKVDMGSITGYDMRFVRFIAGDFNGDGRDDLFKEWETHSTHHGSYVLSTNEDPTGFVNSNLVFPHSITYNDVPGDDNDTYFLVTDMNGNGIDELIVVKEMTVWITWLGGAEYNTETGKVANLFTNPLNSVGYHYEHHAKSLFHIKTGDFNADGMTDLLINTNENESAIFYLDLVNKSLNELCPRMGFPTKWHRVYTGDFNGDGNTDLLTYAYTGTGNKWNIHHFDGKSIFYQSQNCPITGNFDPNPDEIVPDGYYDYNYLISDYNGDGKSDILVINNLTQSQKIYYSYGMNFYIPEQGSYTLRPYAEQLNNIADFNGDGKADCYNIGDLYNPDKILYFHKGELSNNILSFTNGLGARISVDYSNITNDNIYSKGTDSEYPLVDVQPAIYVVINEKADIGNNHPIVKSYKYGKAIIHSKGRGFLGFCNNKIIETFTGIITEINKDLYIVNDDKFYYPFIKSVKKNVSDFTLFESKNVINHKGSIVNQFIFFPYIESTFSKEHDYTTHNHLKTQKQITTYDDFGNVTTIQTLVHPIELQEINPANDYDHEEITSLNYYPSDLNYWLLNRLFRKIQTSRYKNEPQITNVEELRYYQSNEADFPLVKEISYIPDNQASNKLVTKEQFDYDVYGNLTSKTISAPNDAEILAQTYLYDFPNEYQHRFLKTTTNPQGNVSVTTYDKSYGVIKTTTDINGLCTTYDQDPLGINSTVIHPDGLCEKIVLRWSEGHPDRPSVNALYYKWSKISKGKEVITFYDKTGKELLQVTKGFNDEIVYQEKKYNNVGLLASDTYPYFKGSTPKTITYKYDVIGRVEKTTLPDESFTTVQYVGDIVKSANNLGQITEKKSNPLGWIIESKDANGKTVTYNYYSDGNLKNTLLTGYTSTTVSFEYNLKGQKKKMIDPNYGEMIYEYNAFNQLKKEISPKLEETRYIYDLMGRLRFEYSPEGTIEYIYNTNAGKIGSLQKILKPNHSIAYLYDNLLRTISESEVIEDKSFVTTYNYDKVGRILETSYPSGFKTRNYYNNQSDLIRICSVESNSVLWQANSVNALGQVENYIVGNNLTTTQSFYPLTNRLFKKKTGKQGQELVQNLEYGWDEIGNLEYRTKYINEVQNQKLVEFFTYDNLNRLKEIYLNGTIQGNHSYDNFGFGNIIAKQSDGREIFNSAVYGELAGPNALSYANTTVGIFPSDIQDIRYNSYEQPITITEGNKALTIKYGVHKQRISQSFNMNGVITSKIFTGVCEYITNEDNEKILTYLAGPTGIYAIHVKDDNESQIFYIHTDHLGSYNTITDKNGVIVQELSFDAWGNRRDPATWRHFVGNNPDPLFDRGFTGHEHLYAFGLINMNGRLYDPLLSRVLSPDNFVQSIYNTQGFNRYSYCLNNPLIYTDADGEWVHIVVGALAGGIINVILHLDQIDSWQDGLMAFGIGALAGAVGAATGGAAFAAAGGAAGGAGGFLAGGLGGMVGSAATMPIQNVGNALYFGDPLMTVKDYAMGIAMGGLIGGTTNGALALLKGRSFWNGTIDTKPVTLDLKPRLTLEGPKTKAELNTNGLRSEINPLPEVRESGIYQIENAKPAIVYRDNIPVKVMRDPNFRSNLKNVTGMNPGSNVHAHHVFPLEFAGSFKKVGINPNSYGAWWGPGHISNAYKYNQAWMEFFRNTPNYSSDDVFNFAFTLKNTFNY